MAYALNADTAGHAFSTSTTDVTKTADETSTKASFWTRLMNAMIESRMRSVQIELNRHSRFREELEAGKIAVRSSQTFERHS